MIGGFRQLECGSVFGLDQPLKRKSSLLPSGLRRNTAASALAGWKLSTKRDGFADLLCDLAGFRQLGEEEDSQISGLAERTSPTESFLPEQRYKSGLMQRDNVGCEEYRKMQRGVPGWESGGGSEEEMLSCLEGAGGSAEEA